MPMRSSPEIEILSPRSITHPTPQLGFIENADFIRFDDLDAETNRNQSKNKGLIATTSTPNKSTGRRGVKRRFDASTISEEQANAVRRKKGSIITPWFKKSDWRHRNVQQMLTAEISSFVAYIQPTSEEHQLREMMIQMIRGVIQSRWPDADVEPFGSFGSKLYLPGGDIDLVILSTQMMSQQKSKILYKLAPLIRENNIGQDVIVIAKAKVPIIKFKTIHGNINVDISINQTNGLVALKKVNELLECVKLSSQQPRSSNLRHMDHDRSCSQRERDSVNSRRPSSSSFDASLYDQESIEWVVEKLGAARCLILVVKSVLKQRGMNEVYTGGLGSYSITCLVVSFLQLHPKIQRGDIDPNKNLGVLLLEFFELYGKHFNFDQTGISVRKGGYYFSKSHRGWQRERQPYLLSIEDPADENNDISSNSHNILSVRTVFAGAFDLLSATLYHRHSLQSSRSGALENSSSSRPLLSVPVPKQKTSQDEAQKVTLDPMDESLLGEIMGVTKELVENRNKNLKLFRSGTLQRLLQLFPQKPIGSSAKLSASKTSIVSREDHRNEHSFSSTRADGSRGFDDPTRGRECSPKLISQAKNKRLTDVEADRMRSGPKEVNRLAPEYDRHASRAQSHREQVRYDDVENDSPLKPRTPALKKKQKRKNKKNDESPPPQRLWVEDLEPSQVGILERNLFDTDAHNNQESIVTKDESQDEKTPHHSDEHDDEMDSRYRAIHGSKTNASRSTLNFATDNAVMLSSPSGSSTVSKIFHQLSGNQQTYVEDDEDSESDQGGSLNEVWKAVGRHEIGMHAKNVLKRSNESGPMTRHLQEEIQNSNINEGKVGEIEDRVQQEGVQLNLAAPNSQEPLPGTPEGSPESVAERRNEAEMGIGAKTINDNWQDHLLDFLPGTPPSPPISSTSNQPKEAGGSPSHLCKVVEHGDDNQLVSPPSPTLPYTKANRHHLGRKLSLEAKQKLWLSKASPSLIEDDPHFHL